MKKRAVALLMAALIGTVGMTGCGNSQTETTKDTVEETVKQDATEAEEALAETETEDAERLTVHLVAVHIKEDRKTAEAEAVCSFILPEVA